MKPTITISTQKLNRQLQALKLDLIKTMPVEVAKAAQDVHRQIKENVSGTEEMWGKQAKAHPSAVSGHLPVRFIGGLLKSAQKIVMENKFCWKLFSDHNVADYDRFVEFGTFKMFARPFHHNAIANARRRLQRLWGLKVEGMIRKHGGR